MRFRPGLGLLLACLTISIPACDSSESEVLYAQCETYVSVYLGWCARCTVLEPDRCEELLYGSSSPSTYCEGLRPQEADSEDSNFFTNCLQPLDALVCESSFPTVACSLVYDEDLAEEQMND